MSSKSLVEAVNEATEVQHPELKFERSPEPSGGREKKFLVFTDLEPDDMALLLLLAKEGVRNVSIVVGKGRL